ncbi:HD domain-containing protein, partial [Candidatus Poribacteria bacterium]|nr:HD domain-containing protein [Candidatus Poribacteria bacterium]
NESDHEILRKLEDLVQETFTLWDEKRVGFSWRYYFFNHTQRVRALSLTIGRHEGADLRKLEYAALLHDITKRYDGNIMTDKDGKRIIDEDGFWRNEVLLPNPNKSNAVTQLYQEYSQANTLHNISGSFIAKKLLESYGFSDEFCDGVASVVLTHLKPSETSVEKMEVFKNNLEGRILYEADTIDSNLGMVAFFRNIGIHTYGMLKRTGRIDLKEYIDGIPRWLNMKEDFLPRMQTETGLKMGKDRQKRNWEMWEKIEKEKENFQLNEKYGILGVVKYFMSCCEDPNMAYQMEYMENQWIPHRKQMIQDGEINKAEARKSLKSAIEFCSLLSREVRGEI